MGALRLPHIRSAPLSAVDSYLLAVTLFGCAVLGAVVVDASDFLRHGSAGVLGVRGPGSARRDADHQGARLRRDHGSTAFVFALLLLYGTTAAVLAQTASSLMTSIRDRRSVLQTSFALAQQTLSVVVAGMLLSALTDLPRPEASPRLRRSRWWGSSWWAVAIPHDHLLAYAGPAMIEGESFRTCSSAI